MLTEKDYCDYETCVALKELGFREKCPTYYDTKDNVGLLYNTQWADKTMIEKAFEYAEARYDLDYCNNVRDVLNYLKSLVEE